jgi:transposase
MQYFAGLDWGGEKHAVCVVDEAGSVVDRFEAAHDRAGLDMLSRRLGRICSPQQLPIAIERPTGLVVDTLLDGGFRVVPIHPNVVKACRPRYGAAGGKHDRGDAYLLADVLRTDGHRFRQACPNSDPLKALRALVRTRDDLVAERVALANQLRAMLDSFWPGAASVFADVDSPISLAFLTKYPTPQSAERLGEKRLAAFLGQHRYCGRRPAAELLERLRSAPIGRAAEVEAEVKGECVRALVTVLAALVPQIKRLTSRIEHDVAQLPGGRVMMSFPRAGRLNAAQILAEIGDDPHRFLSPDQLAAEAGQCPVTYESGKQRGVGFRWACNQRLRQAIVIFSDNSRHASPWAADVYRRAMARGCKHPHAIRILSRAWIRVLWRALLNGKSYEPASHGAAQRFQIAS